MLVSPLDVIKESSIICWSFLKFLFWLQFNSIFSCTYRRYIFSVSRRKKKCVRYIQGEGSCVSPPSSDGSLLDSPPSSPNMVASPTRDSKPQTEQTQPLSLTLKPDPLAHLSMMPPQTSSIILTESSTGKSNGLPASNCQNGALDHQSATLQQSAPASSLAQPSTSSLHSHNSLSGTQPQPLSLVTKSLE